MSKYRPYITDDGSIGLFSGDVNDVFHSRYGALTEAYEKFVLPSGFDKYLQDSQQLNVLDICYGIGYNTKALINEILNQKLKDKKAYIDSIHVDKNVNVDNNYIDTSDVDNNNDKNSLLSSDLNIADDFDNDLNCSQDKRFKDENILNLSQLESTPLNLCKSDNKQETVINIDALEYEKEFVYLSPLIKNNCYVDDYILDSYVNKIIFNALLEDFPNEYLNELKKYEIIKSHKKYFDLFLYSEAQKLPSRGCKYTIKSKLNALLHNIYYRYITKRADGRSLLLSKTNYQNVSNRRLCDLSNIRFHLKFYFDDARKTIQTLDKKYDIIFLDAFTPSKLPTLWSIDFFTKLNPLLSDNGVLLTYSSSARIRNALVSAGFYIGKVKLKSGEFTGTIAAKDSSKIDYPLSSKELGLLKTKSGLYYKDESLSSSPKAILDNLKADIESSNLMTSSQYLKGVQDEI